MDMTHCPHCHERLTPYTKPDGCVCDPIEYRDPENIPPVCSQYNGDGECNCFTCEHDLECHKPPNDALSRADVTPQPINNSDSASA